MIGVKLPRYIPPQMVYPTMYLSVKVVESQDTHLDEVSGYFTKNKKVLILIYLISTRNQVLRKDSN